MTTSLRPEAAPRRDFLKSAAVLAGSTLAFPAVLRGAPNGAKLKLGLIGCGGRGSGAAANAMDADSNVELTAVADVFEANANGALNNLSNHFKERVSVKPDMKFVGLDAYKKLLATDVDVVILATPPGFRPHHLAAAVDAGKHIFCEKPMAVDPTGVRVVMEAVKKAKEKQLSLVAGFCWRYHPVRMEGFKALHDGIIGDVTSYYATYYTSPVKPMARAVDRKPEWSDVEWQIRNWYNFSWLSGDGYVEQCIHSVDKVAWAMKDQPPISAVATGGRQSHAEGGNIFDHMTVVYEYPNGVMATVGQRQIPGCFNENADYVSGTKGTMKVGNGVVFRGETSKRLKDDGAMDMYLSEHIHFFKAIRSGEVVNDGDRMASSTLLGLMGRMAAYTGQRITWEQIMKSNEDLAPEETLAWDSKFDPGTWPVPGVYDPEKIAAARKEASGEPEKKDKKID